MTSPHTPHGRQALSSLFLALVMLAGSSASLHAQASKRRPKASPSPAAPPSAAPASGTFDLPDPVATVNGTPITRAELIQVARALLSTSGRTLEELNAPDKKHAFQSVLDEIITDRLVSKASADEPVDEMEVEKQFGALRQQYPTQLAFEEALKKAGQTPDQVKTNLRIQLKQTSYVNKRTADQTKIEPLEVEKFYKESPPTKFDAPEMVRASHILIAVRKDAPPEAVLTAENKVTALQARLAKGEAFDALAKGFSDDPTAKQTGGDLDYFSRERIMPEFADAAFRLKVGELSGPVRTQFGIHLIKLTDRKPAHTATLEEAREQITVYLQGEKRKAAVAKLVESLKADAKIDNRIADPS